MAYGIIDNCCSITKNTLYSFIQIGEVDVVFCTNMEQDWTLHTNGMRFEAFDQLNKLFDQWEVYSFEDGESMDE